MCRFLIQNKVVEDPELEFRNHLSTGNSKNRRYKYQDNSNTGKHGLLKNKLDAKRFQNVMLKLEKEILIYKYNTPLIILSDPIYHKMKDI
jgi:hypothetical protein